MTTFFEHLKNKNREQAFSLYGEQLLSWRDEITKQYDQVGDVEDYTIESLQIARPVIGFTEYQVRATSHRTIRDAVEVFKLDDKLRITTHSIFPETNDG